jgi:hypothetical protein
MEATKQPGVLQLVHASFRELPGWEKLAVVVTGALIAPVMAIPVVLTLLALFPLFLMGRFEGDLGEAPLAREINGRVRRQKARTAHYYAT